MPAHFKFFTHHFIQVQERLKPFLPQGETIGSTEEELRATVHSPHFRSAMNSFSSALASGQLAPALAQFALPEAAQEAASRGGSLLLKNTYPNHPGV